MKYVIWNMQSNLYLTNLTVKKTFVKKKFFDFITRFLPNKTFVNNNSVQL